VPVTGAGLNLSISQPNFWKGVAAFHAAAPALVDAGYYASWMIHPKDGLNVRSFVAPNATVEQFNAAVQPLVEKLKALGLTYKMDEPKQFPSFYDLYGALFSPAEDAGANTLVGGRLFSKDDVSKNGDAIVDAIKTVVEAGNPYGGHIVNPGRAVPDPEGTTSAVNPLWRKSADSSLWIYTVDKCQTASSRQKAFDYVTKGFADSLRKASPSSGVYVNEVSNPSVVTCDGLVADL
jgi:hypothetical protein